MKKMVLVLFAVAALVSLDAFARCNVGCAKPCGKKRSCIVDTTVNDSARGTPPCCTRVVEIEEPAVCHKVVDITYTWECPRHCNTSYDRPSNVIVGDEIVSSVSTLQG